MYCARLLGVIVKTKAGIWKPGKRIHMQLRSKVGIIRVLAAVLLATAVPFAATDAAERIPVNPLLFGNNLLCYSDNGFGIWDPQRRCPVEPMLDLACKAGITLWRYPGGCILHHFQWKSFIGPLPRPANAAGELAEATHCKRLFGIDEFMKVCKASKAEAIIGLSYWESTPEDAAAEVEYFNGPASSKWGKRRAANGHAEPYGVKYWEFGNETYHGDHGYGGKTPSVQEYCDKFIAVSRAMKKVDPSIRLGAIADAPWIWDALPALAKDVDFVIIHAYASDPGYTREGKYGEAEAKKAFSTMLSQTEWFDTYFKKIMYYIQEHPAFSGRRDRIKLGITEYNASTLVEKERPWRFTLGEALVVGDFLRVFTDPRNHIGLANYWNFANEFWGQIAGFGPAYRKNPAQLVFEIYKQYFQKYYIETGVIGPLQDKEVDSKPEVKPIMPPPACSKIGLQVILPGEARREGRLSLKNFCLTEENSLTGELPLNWKLDHVSGERLGSKGRMDFYLSQADAGKVVLAETAAAISGESKYALFYDYLTSGILKEIHSDNLLKSGDFEGSEAGKYWDLRAPKGVSISLSSGEGLYGSTALRMDLNSESDINIYHGSQTFTTFPGTTYELTAMMRSDLPEKQEVGLSVQDTRGYRTMYRISPFVTGKSDWTPIRMEFTTASDDGAKSCAVFLRHLGVNGKPGSISGTVWVDDICIRQIGNPLPYLAVKYLDADDHIIGQEAVFHQNVATWTPVTRRGVRIITANASCSADEKKIGLILINKDMERSQPVRICFDNVGRRNSSKETLVALKGLTCKRYLPVKASILNGSRIDALSGPGPDDVNIRSFALPSNDNREVVINMPKHSLIALLFEANSCPDKEEDIGLMLKK